MGRMPLEGVRVVDLTLVWAGPYATQLLAEWGAEVIRMEPLTAIQPQSRGVERSPYLTKEYVEQMAKANALLGAYVDRDPGPDPWNRSAGFNSSSTDKLSFTGNLGTAEGLEIVKRLVAISDVVVENNVPETIDKWGITYDVLADVNPRIIMVRMPGFGLDGEYRNYRAMGNHLEGMSGHAIVRSYPDWTVDAAGETFACDSIAGLNGAIATVMALRHRARTGRGQQVEVPQIEAFAQMMGTEILDYTMNGRVAEAMGNDHRCHAPHNIYPCAGDERWIAIDIATDEQWRTLCRVLDAPELASDERLATGESRWEHRRELDAALAEHTRSRERADLFDALQKEGIAAGPVQDDADCFHCQHLRARGFFEPVTREDIGTYDHPGMIFRWSDTPNGHRRTPVRLGQDNEYVYRDLLGLSDEEYQALVDAGEVGTTYPAWLLSGE